MSRSTVLILGVISFALLVGSFVVLKGVPQKQERVVSHMKLSSSAFLANEPIPSRYTCDGEDVNPPLNWSGAPPTAKSLVLIMDDPDAPASVWTHWVLFNIPMDTQLIPERVSSLGTDGVNSFQKIGYGGPCPPSGTHRYVFTVYALDKTLDVPANSSKTQVLQAMQGHILDSAELVGTYAKK